ncbi:hypothetical protein NCAS_0A03590 [Naumovozyma castellii]|uniref:6-phosphofructo-2-kinase domain-containing protein n=1 Tax=Naumovozyma castellii TaxID=27288 RepID=G0V627_NAUCA|nr:hypothetical protein NCAS_0A03590 [Naumovozyma castellii CBS 4309]CCC66917.1 hypothetical protein NCAS_0A03590 [Naumovozyma castellii CBS 4309]
MSAQQKSNILSDEEELLNGLGSQLLSHPSSNNMARLNKRWTHTVPNHNGGHHRRARTIATPTSSFTDLSRHQQHLIDGVHDPVIMNDDTLSPGQLYSTDSGKLFHAGRILVVLVGLPATSKTLLSVAITRYTRWLGVRTESFHISKYKADVDKGSDLSLDIQSAAPVTEEGKQFKKTMIKSIVRDMIMFFIENRGQLAIYDALNILASDREELNRVFSKLGVKVLFIESIMNDAELVHRNIEMAIQSNDYVECSKEEAIERYMKRLTINEPLYETMTKEEKGVSFIKYINFGEKLVVMNNQYGYLINKIVFFLMNLRDKKGCVYFARCGTSDKDKYIDDEYLNEEGLEYSKLLTETMLRRLEDKKKRAEQGDKDENISPLIVWTSPRKRTYDSGRFFLERGIPVTKRNLLKQLNPGAIADLSKDEIKEKYPAEYKESLRDPYHYRFPRAESYHDLAVRMEPLLLELEHTSNNVLIIAHESTIRVLFGYLMACTCIEVPNLKFTRDHIIEISFSPFCNKVRRISIPDGAINYVV